MRYERKGRLVRVIDGDSVICWIDYGFRQGGEWDFRLYGCNMPETRGPERTMGLLAKAKLVELFEPWSEFVVETHKDQRDKYGRYLADFFFGDGTNLKTILLEGGWALPYDGDGPRPRFDLLAPYPTARS